MAEESNRRFGEAIARLRTKRGWSRAKLIARLFEFIDDEKRDYGTVSETWLKRLEKGETVKVTRALVEELSSALRCSPTEEASLLYYADRKVLPTDDSPNKINEMLNHLLFLLRDDALEILGNLTTDRHIERLTDDEQFELPASALELALKRRWKKRLSH
jgi:transcriptional regulator with XRE-family HTH domain